MHFEVSKDHVSRGKPHKNYKLSFHAVTKWATCVPDNDAGAQCLGLFKCLAGECSAVVTACGMHCHDPLQACTVDMHSAPVEAHPVEVGPQQEHIVDAACGFS